MNKQEFASKDLTIGQINAIVKKLGGKEEAERFLRGETIISEPEHAWREQDGVIYFSVTSDGTTGEEWVKRLEKKNFQLTKWAKDVLNSPNFKPTEGITTKIAVLKGILFSNVERITHRIRSKAEELKYYTPNAEIACLIREKFSDKDIEEMGLWRIIAMHESIKNSDGALSLLGARRNDDGHWIDACYDDPGLGWDSEAGFAFVVSQVKN